MQKEKLYVIKIGGNIIDAEKELNLFLREFALLDGKKLLIHGGGKLATKLAAKLGIEQQLIDGRRITDTDTLDVVTMVYAGLINKQIVAKLQSLGCNAAGLSGADGNLVLAHKRVHPSIDYGWVGDVDAVNAKLLSTLLQNGFSLVIAPITHNGEGQLLNTNADTIAQETAKAMSQFFDVQLIYGFEKSGVLRNAEDDGSVIPMISSTNYQALKEEKIIFGGMIPKLDNAFAALNSGVKEVIIGNALHLRELIYHTQGTKITNEKS